MAYEIFTIAGLNPQGVRRFQVAPGSAPIVENGPLSAASPTSAGIAPDGSFAATWTGLLRIHPDLDDMPSGVIQPSIQPSGSGAGSQMAVSPSFLAVSGGTTSAILVYDKNGNNITVSSVGLGTIFALQFSLNGAYLFVGHSATPFFRVYNTATWGYVDAPATGGSKYGVLEARNGKLIALSPTTPYWFAYDLAANTMTGISALSAYIVSTFNMPTFCADPANADCVYMGSNTSAVSAVRLARYNTVSGVITAMPAVTALLQTTPSAVKQCVPDDLTGRVHVFAGAAAAQSDLPTLFAFDAASFAPDPKDTWGQGTHNAALLVAGLRNRSHCGVVSGTVRDVSNNPAARTVRAYHSASGKLLGVTQSRASDGAYTLKLGTQDPVDLVFKIAAGENLNNLIQARVVPQPA